VLAAQMSSMDFAYRDPERNWNRSRVKGVSSRQWVDSCTSANAECYMAVGKPGAVLV